MTERDRQELEPNYFMRAQRTPVELRLDGATVVNGAQTVHAIYAASRRADDHVEG